jgi:hypothetical protein
MPRPIAAPGLTTVSVAMRHACPCMSMRRENAARQIAFSTRAEFCKRDCKVHPIGAGKQAPRETFIYTLLPLLAARRSPAEGRKFRPVPLCPRRRLEGGVKQLKTRPPPLRAAEPCKPLRFKLQRVKRHDLNLRDCEHVRAASLRAARPRCATPIGAGLRSCEQSTPLRERGGRGIRWG